MAKFLNTEKAGSEIVEIIIKAEKRLVLISPYIKLSELMLQRLQETDRKGNVQIIIVCRGKDLIPETKRSLKQLKNLELRFLENIHAKCFYNEKCMAITSLNLHEFSQGNNREMGILLDLQTDGFVFMEALKEANSIVRLATLAKTVPKAYGNKKYVKKNSGEHGGNDLVKKSLSTLSKMLLGSPDSKKKKGKSTSKAKKDGYCIKCRAKIPLNKDKPLCHPCWIKTGRPRTAGF